MVLVPKVSLTTHGALRPHGIATRTWDAGKVEEFDLLTCAHCQFTWRYVPGSGRKRGWCTHCNGPVCGKPMCMSRCLPWEEKLYIEERAAARRAAG